MGEWIYFVHPPRENFAATMTDEENAAWSVHFERFKRLLVEGLIILVRRLADSLRHRPDR